MHRTAYFFSMSRKCLLAVAVKLYQATCMLLFFWPKMRWLASCRTCMCVVLHCVVLKLCHSRSVPCHHWEEGGSLHSSPTLPWPPLSCHHGEGGVHSSPPLPWPPCVSQHPCSPFLPKSLTLGQRVTLRNQCHLLHLRRCISDNFLMVLFHINYGVGIYAT